MSTVARILRKETQNPTAQNILNIAEAVGYDIMPKDGIVLQEAAPDSAYIRHIITMYESRITDQQREYNRVTAEKNRWIKYLSIIVAALAIGIVAILLIDITNPTVGWYRNELAKYTDNVGIFNQLLQGFRDWLGTL